MYALHNSTGINTTAGAMSSDISIIKMKTFLKQTSYSQNLHLMFDTLYKFSPLKSLEDEGFFPVIL